MTKDIITYIVFLIAILGMIIAYTLFDLKKAGGQEIEPVAETFSGISLTGREVAFLAKILYNPNYQPDINEWRINGEMLTLLQKLQDYNQRIAIGTYNQQVIKLNDLIQ